MRYVHFEKPSVTARKKTTTLEQKSLKIPKGLSEPTNRSTDNTMANIVS